MLEISKKQTSGLFRGVHCCAGAVWTSCSTQRRWAASGGDGNHSASSWLSALTEILSPQNQARLRRKQQRTEEGMVLCQNAISILEAALGPQTIDLYQTTHHRHRIQAQVLSNLQPQKVQMASALSTLAGLHRSTRDYDQAEVVMRRALQVIKDLFLMSLWIGDGSCTRIGSQSDGHMLQQSWNVAVPARQTGRGRAINAPCSGSGHLQGVDASLGHEEGAGIVQPCQQQND